MMVVPNIRERVREGAVCGHSFFVLERPKLASWHESPSAITSQRGA